MIAAGPPYAAAGSPPPTILPRQVRSGAIRTAPARRRRQAEAGHDLVEDQDAPHARRERAQPFEEALARSQRPALPTTGSTMIAARSRPCASIVRSTARGR
jgi:hypothetical protein